MTGFAFTTHVRTALMRARDHAASRHHEYIGTEHLLLGLLDETIGPAAAVLTRLGLDRAAVRDAIDAISTTGKNRGTEREELPYTSRSKKVLELAMLAARRQEVEFVDSAHLLQGILDEEMGIGAQVLAAHGLTRDDVRPALGGLQRDEAG